jgi:hypothetical protein
MTSCSSGNAGGDDALGRLIVEPQWQRGNASRRRLQREDGDIVLRVR